MEQLLRGKKWPKKEALVLGQQQDWHLLSLLKKLYHCHPFSRGEVQLWQLGQWFTGEAAHWNWVHIRLAWPLDH